MPDTSNISTLRETFQKTGWKVAFAAALIRLRPDMNPDAADEVSDIEYAGARGSDPDVAAHRWSAQHLSDARESIPRSA